MNALSELTMAIAAGAAVMLIGKKMLDRGMFDPSPRGSSSSRTIAPAAAIGWTAADQEDQDLGAAMRAAMPATSPDVWTVADQEDADAGAAMRRIFGFST